MVLQVTLIKTNEELDIAKALRWNVFIDEQGFDGELEVDKYDTEDTTYHFLGKDTEADKYVAVARCLVDPEQRKGKIGRVAVLQECRGKRFGAAIIKAIEEAMDDKCDKFALSAQYDKVGFYEKFGYHRSDDKIYLDEEVEHCDMEKKIR